MDVDSTYSTDVTIRDTDGTPFIISEQMKGLVSQVAHRKGRGFHDQQMREEMRYETLGIQPGETGPAQSIQGWILIVTNIHTEASEEDIANVFGEYGALKSIHLNIDRRTGYVKGYALIEYDSYKEANKAREHDKKVSMLGQVLGVDWAFSVGPLYRNQ